jgi:hypothetical protein
MNQRWLSLLLLGGGLLFLIAAGLYHFADLAQDVTLLQSARLAMVSLGSLLFLGVGTFLVSKRH